MLENTYKKAPFFRHRTETAFRMIFRLRDILKTGCFIGTFGAKVCIYTVNTANRKARIA